MPEKYQSFTELEVWKKARVLKNEVKDLTNCFPSEEKYRLTDQLIRASRSINSNIAEGLADLHLKISYISVSRREVP